MPLTKGTVGFAFRTSIDLFLLAATGPFIALGVFAAIKNGNPVDEKEWAMFRTGMNLVCHTSRLDKAEYGTYPNNTLPSVYRHSQLPLLRLWDV